jgi:NADPH:quinone reductase-like Zn-dependent oxidoreductase
MKAIVWTKYGAPDGLQLCEIATPPVGENDILIKVHAAAVSQADTEFRQLKLPFLFSLPLRLYLGLIRPTRIKVLGTEFAGEVVSTGPLVTGFQVGDPLFGYTGLGMGTYAEYLRIAEKPSALASVIGLKPANLTYVEAAAVPFGGIEALHALRQAHLQKGQKVLIVGAGGSIGTYAVQLARHYGAEVTGVDKAGKLDMLRSIGADHVIDYAREDFTQNGQVYDVVLDTIGKSPFAKTLRVLSEHGTYLNANPGLFGGLSRTSRDRQKRVIPWSGGYSAANLLAVKELVEAGTIRPVIDRRYPLEQAAEAHRYVDTGQKKGNVVLMIAG